MSTPSSGASPKRVLVIDDQLQARSLIRELLESAGYVVSDMESAEHVEQIVQDFGPHLVLTDMIMPGRDGLEVCHSLRSNPKMKDIQVVLVTAKGFEGDRKAALEAGAAGYVVKPFDATQLLEVVKRVLADKTILTVWGCRGSIPTPERANGPYGGNTACVDLTLPHNQHIVFDAGTGIRPLGHRLVHDSPIKIALCLTHFHWDHIFGLPFFAPFYIAENEIHIHGPGESNDALRAEIRGEMGGDYFPVSIEAFSATVIFNALREEEFEALGVPISTMYALHPCRTLAYRVDLPGGSIVYTPDNEILPESVVPRLSGEALRFAEFARGASLLLHDCTYSQELYEKRRGWGHTGPYSLAAVAAHARVKRVLLFHHDPESCDEDVEAIHREFQEALQTHGADIPSEPAREGMSFEL